MEEATESYFSMLKQELTKAYGIATEARKKGYEPISDVEIKIAKDIAARVEGIVGPPNIAKIIREMEAQGLSREDIAFEVVKKIANGEIIKGNPEYLIEQAVRTGVGIITEGVLVAPTEGISKVKIRKNQDGSNYVAVYYAGPIRSAGGTAAALSVVLADIARRAAGVGEYRATETQIERYVEEILVYETRVSHLQYLPPEDHIRIIISNCPVCIDGDPTEDTEVSAYKNVPGIETDRIRGGVPLVVCEGIAQKAAKILKYAKKLNLGWNWLESIIKVKVKKETAEIKPDETYLEGLVAGRPVFAYPSTPGGFRLRYGKSETNGLMGKNIHPATMILLDNFLAYGTHMKIERPGKGCVVMPHAGIEPPVVLLHNGEVLKVMTVEQAKALRKQVKEILFLGDILITYGDFLKTNHPLLPSGYCKEIWELEAREVGIEPPTEFKEPREAFEFSRKYGLPLHPDYTLPWHDISIEELKELREWLKQKIEKDGNIFLPKTPQKKIIEKLLAEHRVVEEKIVLDKKYSTILKECVGNEKDFSDAKNCLEAVTKLSGVKIRPWAPIYIGARMGRPEKAKERAMEGKPNVLFPTGSEKNRSLIKEVKNTKFTRTLNLDLAHYCCTKCNQVTFYRKCHLCNNEAKLENRCIKCGKIVFGTTHCGEKTTEHDVRPIDIQMLFENVKQKLAFAPEDVRGVKGLSNATRIPERLEKGFLRARYGICVFRDGTCRFDATNVPLTHFIPKEIGLDVEKAKKLGYTTDYLGNKLENDGQLVELKQQDIVLSKNGLEYLFRVSKFIDELLINLYGLPPYYMAENPTDLIGHLCTSLSPHTSAAVLCRIIGYTEANIGYGHPYLIAARRRNCDGDEDSIMLLLDCLLNFSKRYLSESRGGTMDAPLVLTTIINPKEIDDEAHCIEVVSSYPLEFYRACEKFAMPGDVKIRTVKDVLGSDAQYKLLITHIGTFFNGANIKTAYVSLENVPEKVKMEFDLHDKIRAVDKNNAAERLVLSHFIPDLYGNLRSFSRQEFRCSSCNRKYRRVPLLGRCVECGGNLILTINQGGIQKYLTITKETIEKYNLPDYLQQRIALIEKEINNIFEDEKERQLGLSDFV